MKNLGGKKQIKRYAKKKIKRKRKEKKKKWNYKGEKRRIKHI